MAADRLAFDAKRLLGLGEANKLDGDDSALVEELEETVLSVGAWFSKIHHRSFVFDFLPFCVDPLSIAFHIQLLDVWCELTQSLTIWDNGSGRIVLNCGAVKAQQTQK